MCSDSIKDKMKSERDKLNQTLFDFALSRPYTLIMILALLCTLIAKLYQAIDNSMLPQYPGWILSDIAFLLGIEVTLALFCFSKPQRWRIRLSTVIAAVVCLWSFLNAGWVIRTGTQILPNVLLTVFRDPLNAFRMIGINLINMPLTAVALLLPGMISLSFFFYVLTKTRLPIYNRKRFFIRFNASIIVCLAALALRPTLIINKSHQLASLEMQYNAQLKAITSLFCRQYKPPRESERRVPLLDELKVSQGLQMKKYNIVVIVLEGVQYEQTSLSGNQGDLTPFLSELASQGVEFTNMRSTLTHTTKALFTLMTGRYASASQDIVEAVPAEKPYASLSTILRRQLGYRTAFFQSARGDFECRSGLVYNLGFDKFFAREDLNEPNKFISYLGCDEFAMLKPIAKWIKSDSRPFLLTYMCSVTHDRYEVPKWYGQQPKEEIDSYKQTISYTDKFLSSLETELSDLGILNNTIFCVIGDHGEGFKEHGLSGHDRIVFDEGLHVPFCIKAPSIEPGTVISSPVSSIDLTPTLLELLGFKTEKAGFDGIDVLGNIKPDRRVYFSGWLYESPAGFIQGDFKYIFDPIILQTLRLYDLKNDPYEQNITDVPEEKAQKIIDEIQTWRESTIFQYDRDYKGKDFIIFNRWKCKWNNREATAKYISPEQAKEIILKNKQ